MSEPHESPDLRVRGLTRSCERMHAAFEASLPLLPAPQALALQALGGEALEAVERIGVWCERAGINPSALPDPTRRAYAWLGFLCDPAERESHLQALRIANGVDGRVRVRFFNTASLYRFVPDGDKSRLTAHQAFVGAPEEVLRALVRLGIPHARKRKLRAVVMAHTETAEFRGRIAALDRFRRPDVGAARGQHMDLAEAFDRVNRAFFDGRMSPPHLAWSPAVRRQEFGRYEASSDTVLLNRALDGPDVPAFVVDYVMVHELLHKVLGVHVHNGRRQVHTRAFRQAEQSFAQYAESERWLKKLGEQLRRG